MNCKSLILSFFTRKFLIAVAIEIAATTLTYYAFDIIVKTAMNAKEQASTLINIFEIWAYFTIGNATSFGLFNNVGKFAHNGADKLKASLPQALTDKISSTVSAAMSKKDIPETTKKITIIDNLPMKDEDPEPRQVPPIPENED
jgi:hypothetical protein